jgi:hypothetical protein
MIRPLIQLSQLGSLWLGDDESNMLQQKHRIQRFRLLRCPPLALKQRVPLRESCRRLKFPVRDDLAALFLVSLIAHPTTS